ncbi:MAG: nucleoside deaminase [Promethearchaeota archaeon]
MISLTIPDWVQKEIKKLPQFIPNIEDRMRAVIHFSQLNLEYDTGGPFAAGVFERDSGKLIAMGVNRVIPCNCSSAHAEIMALSLAQQKLHAYDLGGPGMPVHQLVVNWRPCVMCYGAVLWSGIRSLVIAGSGPELEDITGFDEGPMHVGWREELEKRGIELIENVLKEEACQVYIDFSSRNSFVYNSRLGKKI